MMPDDSQVPGRRFAGVFTRATDRSAPVLNVYSITRLKPASGAGGFGGGPPRNA